MLQLVIGFGVLIVAMSLWGVMRPQAVVTTVSSFADSKAGWLFAILIRILLGGALIAAAPLTDYTLAFRALGVLTLLAAAGLLAIGQHRMMSVVRRVSAWPPQFMRIAFALGVALGGLLVFAAI